MEELKERLGRMKRLIDNPDFVKTKQEIDNELGVNQPSTILMKAGIDPAILGILSGMRDYSIYWDNLARNLEAQIEQDKQQTEEME